MGKVGQLIPILKKPVNSSLYSHLLFISNYLKFGSLVTQLALDALLGLIGGILIFQFRFEIIEILQRLGYGL